MVTRYARANNKNLENPSDYDPELENSSLLYLDACQLYATSLCEPLPTGDFKWVDPGKVEWSNLSRDAPHGYFLEVDVTIPEHLHGFLDELPPLPENRVGPTAKTWWWCWENFKTTKHTI